MPDVLNTETENTAVSGYSDCYGPKDIGAVADASVVEPVQLEYARCALDAYTTMVYFNFDSDYNSMKDLTPKDVAEAINKTALGSSMTVYPVGISVSDLTRTVAASVKQRLMTLLDASALPTLSDHPNAVRVVQKVDRVGDDLFARLGVCFEMPGSMLDSINRIQSVTKSCIKRSNLMNATTSSYAIVLPMRAVFSLGQDQLDFDDLCSGIDIPEYEFSHTAYTDKGMIVPVYLTNISDSQEELSDAPDEEVNAIVRKHVDLISDLVRANPFLDSATTYVVALFVTL